MKYSVIIILLFAFVQQSYSQSVIVNSPVRFLALGDSYTIGQGVYENERWPNQLVDALKAKGIEMAALKVIARTGWRTDDLLSAIERKPPASTYNLVSLLIGVNNQYQGASIDTYHDEFKHLLNQAIRYCGGNKSGVFVLSIPDYGFTPFGISNQESISKEIDQYNIINKKISEEMGISYFNVTDISRQALDQPDLLASDDLHPGGSMYKMWVDLILRGIVTDQSTSSGKQAKAITLFNIYPNPAQEIINIIPPSETRSIQIYTVQGKELYKNNISSEGTITIDLNSWPSGTYLIQFNFPDNSAISSRFSISH